MTADEMFEKLGYTRQEFLSKENTLIYINYYNEWNTDCYDSDASEQIYFELENKTFYKEIDFEIGCITMEELKAINKKVSELGWGK